MKRPWSTPSQVRIAKELPYLSRAEAAEFLRLEEATLRSWATQDRGPRFVKLGAARSSPVLYARREVAAYIADPIGYEEKQARSRVRSGDAIADGAP
jgi:hypothetical protein